MAEVLAPVQVQPTPSITMLHSSQDHYQNASSGQSQAQSPRLSAMPRTHVYNASAGSTGYRGSSSAPISPYAFQATPQLRQDNRASSAPQVQHHPGSHNGSRSGQSNASSISTNASTVSSASSRSGAGQHITTKDDMALSTAGGKSAKSDTRPLSMNALTSSVPDLSLPPVLPAADSTPKASPNRYRRTAQRQDSSPASQSPQASSVAFVTQQNTLTLPVRPVSQSEMSSRPAHVRTTSDDISTPSSGSTEQAKRYRRRSLGGFEGAAVAPTAASTTSTQTQGFNGYLPPLKPINTQLTEKPRSRDGQRDSRDAGRPTTDRRESYQSGRSTSASTPRPASPRTRADARASSPIRTSDSSKRPAQPSPLSKPVTPDVEIPSHGLSRLKDSVEAETDAPAPPSAAVQQLAALSEQDANKGKKSRLRRAFSFGSAAELRKASAQNAHVERERNKLTKERSEAELQEAQDAARTAELEKAGLGNSIYSGQGGVFASSTDNLSISSTASSASLMLRKMGQGMKKGARSVKGLFRPKSVIGVPAADGPITTEPSQAQVSMVTVEAERERVNVDAHPHQKDGGTGFPHLERNSLDASTVAETVPVQAPVVNQRKSIVGGDSERDEVLRAVRKGILKRTGTGASSGTASPVTSVHGATHSPAEYGLPQVPHILDSPLSSQPGTPTDQTTISKSSSFPNPNGGRPDYFSTQTSRPFASQSTRSLPNTPNGSRNIAFNPRIQFHDVWSPTEYDRRGDIATCNRLTPMLAQQIKEELNSFKMEMEVHELSKPHTHFF